MKIPSTIINAYDAILQENAGGNSDFVIFSSWLPALVSGTATEGVGEGRLFLRDVTLLAGSPLSRIADLSPRLLRI